MIGLYRCNSFDSDKAAKALTCKIDGTATQYVASQAAARCRVAVAQAYTAHSDDLPTITSATPCHVFAIPTILADGNQATESFPC
jgi:hypothetical protein